MGSVLTSDRLTLRPYETADLDEMAAMFADAEVTLHTLLGRRSLDQTAAILDQYMDYFARHGFGMWAITARDGGGYLGECGVFDSPTGDGRHYLRYALRRSAWGRGIASEASAAVIDAYFKAAPGDWLMAGVTPSNAGSLRVMEKLGFARTDRVTVHGIDFVLFELTRSRWSARG